MTNCGQREIEFQILVGRKIFGLHEYCIGVGHTNRYFTHKGNFIMATAIWDVTPRIFSVR
jgi:hypothetical protein